MIKKEIECSNCYATNRYYSMYKYKNEYYCSECLLELLSKEKNSGFSYEDTRTYYYAGELIGTDNDYSPEEIVKELMDYGEEIEVEEDE